MTTSTPKKTNIAIRPVQYRDLEAIESLAASSCEEDWQSCSVTLGYQLQQLRRWYGLLKLLSWFPNPLEHHFHAYVAKEKDSIRGWIQVAPFNKTGSTWRVERTIESNSTTTQRLKLEKNIDIASILLRHCFENIWKARTWLVEVNIHHKKALATYRQNGFQPLGQINHWSIAPEIITQVSKQDSDLPNLLSVSNVDAPLLYKLYCASIPYPLLREVFDLHIQDFRSSLLDDCIARFKHWFTDNQVTQGYVFEPQRKEAIGYFKLEACLDGSRPHIGKSIVHPGYSWLYPKLLAKMAKILADLPPQSLQVTSTDYQPDREEYLEKLGATVKEHNLLMSRSVWHKIREPKPLEALQWSEVLKGLQPARTPIPSRMSFSKEDPKVKLDRNSSEKSLSDLKSQAQNSEQPAKDNQKTDRSNG